MTDRSGYGMSSSYKPDKQTHVRYLIVLMLFAASALSYGDRVVLSITGIAMARDIHMGALRLGYLFSGFSWAYVAGQLPAGGLLDSFGSKRVYGVSIVCWSICGALVGFAGYLPAAFVFIVILGLRLVSGLAQSPVFPGNGRIVAAWFPAAERGTASAVFNSSQYFSLVMFGPLFGWLVQRHGWRSCFWFMGVFGFVLAFAWWKTVHNVKEHPLISAAEIDHIEKGGGLA